MRKTILAVKPPSQPVSLTDQAIKSAHFLKRNGLILLTSKITATIMTIISLYTDTLMCC